MNLLFNIMLPFLLATAITAMLIPCWIQVCSKWKLFEQNNDRKKHRHLVPSMGGLALYAGIFVPFLFLSNDLSMQAMKALTGASLILFFTGFFDDLLDTPALRKLGLQLFASFFIAAGGIRITHAWGLFGLEQIPHMLQIPVTMLFIVCITNAYNFIDGLDGLAASIGLIISVAFGTIFYLNQQHDMAVLSACISGALLGFLFYNFHPAQLFMGDTGSLVLGSLMASQAILFLEPIHFSGHELIAPSPLLAVAALFIPAYDLLRVTTIRLLTGNSPFKADRNHLHHMLQACGFGQRSTVLLLGAINVFYLCLAMLFSTMSLSVFLILNICIGMLLLNMRTMTFLAQLYHRLGGRLHRPGVTASKEGFVG